MPARFWRYPCCSVQSGSQSCPSHGQDATGYRWLLRMHESMLCYQLHFGWKPIGPHRGMGDALFGAVSKRCLTCDGGGLIDRRDADSCSICESCHGFGVTPLPGAPELDAIRQQVGAAFPDALTAYDPASAIRRLRNALSGSTVVLHDLETGTMIDPSPERTGGAQ